MSGLKFNHVFVGLLALSALSAFVINPKYTNRIRNVQALFSPVASPTRKITFAIHERISKPEIHDPRALADIRAENEQLRSTLMSLSGQLDEMRRIDAELSKLGDLRAISTRVGVVGPDTGASESLNLRGTSLDGIAEEMPVVYSGGVVGRIARAGVGGSQVRLITDRSFRATAVFKYFERTANRALVCKPRPTEPAVAQGDGKGAILVSSVGAKDAEKIRIGDELVLADEAWPITVKGYRLGQVVSKTQRREAPLFYEIRVQPQRNLKELSDVSVVTK